MRLHHVQVSCPPGGEDLARRFWVDGLGFGEVGKPAALAARGGAWFRAFGPGGEVRAEVHVGVEEPFVAARRAHPALVVDDDTQLGSLGERLERLGFEVDHRERESLPSYLRLHAHDGHGNRVELLAPR